MECDGQWKKIEEVAHEVLVVLFGTPVGKRLAQVPFHPMSLYPKSISNFSFSS